MFDNLFASEAFKAVQNRNFRFFLGYRFLMTTATLMQSVIVSWHMYSLTFRCLPGIMSIYGIGKRLYAIPPVCCFAARPF